MMLCPVPALFTTTPTPLAIPRPQIRGAGTLDSDGREPKPNKAESRKGVGERGRSQGGGGLFQP